MRISIPSLLTSLLGACCLWAAPAADVAAAPAALATPKRVASVEGIDEYRLPNGLQVLLVADDSKPTTTVNLTYRVGSRHENYGETGMAHLLEHLLFKGSPRHPAVWAEFEKRGLRANGSTWFDRTNYTATFSANDDNLRWYLGWQADAMVNSFIARKDLDTEMTVVRNEMEMGENSPDRILFEKTLSAMYQWHNYGKSTIGARADVENVDIARLQAFYKRYYQPDNATLIVSGKFPRDKVLAWVAQAYSTVKAPQRARPRLYTLDPAQDGERAITLRRTGGVPLLFAGYHVPPGSDPDFAAIELLSLVMGDEPSGRLHKRLTEKQLAASTFAFTQGLADPGFAIFGAQLAPGQELGAARTAMLDTLESVAKEPLTAEELARAKSKWIKSWEQGFSNPETVGIQLSESVATGDWRLYFALRDRVQAVKLADVQRVAEQRLLTSNRTLGTYVPTDAPQRAPAPAPAQADVAKNMADFQPKPAQAAVESFEATPANIDARTRLSRVGGVQLALLPKGTRSESVRAVLQLNYGDEKSLQGQGEVADALAALLDKGTATLSRQQVQDRLDELKSEIGFASAPGRIVVSIDSRRQHLPALLTLLGDMLRHPALKVESLEEHKQQLLSAIEQQRKEPEAVAANALARLGNPYPRSDVRYARSFDEIVQDVQALDVNSLKAFHARFLGASNAEFSAVGDMDEPAVRQALQGALADWTSPQPYQRVAFPLVKLPAERLVLPTPDKQNATLLAKLALPLTDEHPDYPALMLANQLLGGGGNSRLWTRIRENEGLSYDVRSGIGWSSTDANSVWQFSAIFAPQNRGKVETALREEIARALKDGFTADELANGQRGVLNTRRLSRAQDANVARALASNLHLDRRMAISAKVDAAIARLSVDEVNAALRKHLQPEALAWALAGDFKP